MKFWIILAVMFGIMLAIIDTIPSMSLGRYAQLNDQQIRSNNAAFCNALGSKC